MVNHVIYHRLTCTHWTYPGKDWIHKKMTIDDFTAIHQSSFRDHQSILVVIDETEINLAEVTGIIPFVTPCVAENNAVVNTLEPRHIISLPGDLE